MKNSLEKTFAKFGKQKAKGGEKPTPPKHRPLRFAIIAGIGIGLFLSLNLAIYLHETQIERVRVERLVELSEQRAELAAGVVEKYIAETRGELSTFSQAASVVQAVSNNDKLAMASAVKKIVGQIDGALAARFILLGEAGLDSEASLPIRFTELEMIKRVEKGEDVLPEAVKIDAGWRINIVSPVITDASQPPIATLILSLDVAFLQTKVIQNRASVGKLAIWQKFGSGTPLVVMSSGQGTAGKAVNHTIENSYWYVEFTPSYALYEDAKTDAKKVYALIAVATLVLVFLGFYFGRIVGLAVEAKIQARSAQSKSSHAPAPKKAKSPEMTDPMYQNADILDVDIVEEDEALLGLDEVESPDAQAESTAEEAEDILDIQGGDDTVPDVVFRAYDIRGIAKEQISTTFAQSVGQALGSEALDNNQDTLIVARDARLSSPELTEFLIRGILSTGCHVLNIGTVPTPLMYFAVSTLKQSQSGVMVTASHNAGEYNGFKVVMNGKARCGEDIKAIRRRILRKDIYQGSGEESRHDVVADYIDTIFSDVALAGDVSIVIDAGNGVTGVVAPKLFEELGCEVTPLFCDLDGHFPNHSPDPSIPANLTALIEKVKEVGANLGVAFDGDGDRLIVVTSSGKIIWPDRLLMLFAKDIVSRNPGADVVFDVKSTKHLSGAITSYGGRPIMWKTGHAPMKNKMLETDALLGGEFSGHIFIKDRWFGFDDGMYAAARLIEILSLQEESLDEMFDEFPVSPATPEIRVPIAEESKFDVITRLSEIGDFGEGRVTKIDGIRVDYPYGWGLVRASNTSANLTLRFEADDADALHKVKSAVAQELKKVDPTLKINWNA